MLEATHQLKEHVVFPKPEAEQPKDGFRIRLGDVTAEERKVLEAATRIIIRLRNTPEKDRSRSLH